MEYMGGLEDNAFDLAIVDPPYGIGNWVQLTGKTAQNPVDVKWNNDTPTQLYFDEMMRVSVNYICWGWNYYTEFLGSTNQLIYWDKKMGSPTYSAGELANTSISGSLTSVTIPLMSQNPNHRVHPCQKPVKLYAWLLANYAKEGDRILDTHLGSGSSAIAAHYGGFDFVGMEIDKDYYDAAVKRFNSETAQVDMFAAPWQVEPVAVDAAIADFNIANAKATTAADAFDAAVAAYRAAMTEAAYETYRDAYNACVKK